MSKDRVELLFDENTITGEVTTFVMEDGAEEFQLVTKHPLDAVLESNQQQRKDRDKHTRWNEQSHVAAIPNFMLADLRKQGILDDQKAIRKWLNDPDNQIWRTRQGHV